MQELMSFTNFTLAHGVKLIRVLHPEKMADLPKPMMPNFTGGPVVFFKEVKAELGKVIWPTRDEVVKLTVIVIALSIAIGLYVGGLDLVFTAITDTLLKR